MKLTLHTGGAAEPIEILSPAPHCRFRLGDAEERSAHVEVAEPCVYSVLMDGRSYDARVEETPAGLVVVIDGYRFEIEVRDPRRWSRKAGARAREGIQTVAAPMPGKVVRVLVAPGEAVEAGQGSSPSPPRKAPRSPPAKSWRPWSRADSGVRDPGERYVACRRRWRRGVLFGRIQKGGGSIARPPPGYKFKLPPQPTISKRW
jgi:hypothetical protein